MFCLEDIKEEEENMFSSDIINWDEYFMGIAVLSSKRSKDPKTKVGACIVDDKNRIVSVGYNGMPNGCNDDDFCWSSYYENKEESKDLYGKNFFIFFYIKI